MSAKDQGSKIAEADVNDWFKFPNTPITDMAHMLIELDDKGHIPDGMRKAIYKHAQNTLSSTPLSISGLSMAIASAHSGGGLSDMDAANASYGIASLADELHAMNEMEWQFGPENQKRKAA